MKKIFPAIITLLLIAASSHAQDDPCMFGEQHQFEQSSAHPAKARKKNTVEKTKARVQPAKSIEQSAVASTPSTNTSLVSIQPPVTGCDAWLPVETEQQIGTAAVNKLHTAVQKQFSHAGGR